MNPVILLPDGQKYGGQYVCLKSFSDDTVISHGINPTKTLHQAEKKGYPHPVIVWIPPKDTTLLF